MENKKYKVIIGILVVLLIASLCVICFLLGRDYKKEEPKKEQETKEVEKKEETKKEEKKEEEKKTTKEEYKIKEVLYDTTSYGNDSVEKVELTTDGTVLVSITGDDEVKINRKEVAHEVLKAFEVNVGQSDICEGNKRIIFLVDGGIEGGAAMYIDIDQLVCAHNVSVKPISGVENIVSIEEKRVKYPGEPDGYTVYAITKDGKKIDISDKLDYE